MSKNPATVQSEQGRTRRLWYMWCPRCKGEGPKRVRFGRAKSDKDDHVCPGRTA